MELQVESKSYQLTMEFDGVSPQKMREEESNLKTKICLFQVSICFSMEYKNTLKLTNC
jgi:hypothetical protein